MELKNLKENVFLADYTTFCIGGPARYFFEAKTEEDIKNVLIWAKQRSLPYFVLGGGSNLLVSDKGFEGIIIKVSSLKFQVSSSEKIIRAESGVLLSKLIIESVRSGLAGLEWAIGIPGTIGGAVCGNAGAYGHNISESVLAIKAINSDGKTINLKKDDCCFCYRGSIFKEKNNNLVITEAVLWLADNKNNKAQEEIKEVIAARRNKIPSFPSSGSFFKNLKLTEQTESFKKNIPQERIKNGMVPAAFLIEQCGLKGKTIGRAQISEKHANFIVNLGGATAADVLQLVKTCKEKVKNKFGIKLQEETICIGF